MKSVFILIIVSIGKLICLIYLPHFYKAVAQLQLQPQCRCSRDFMKSKCVHTPNVVQIMVTSEINGDPKSKVSPNCEADNSGNDFLKKSDKQSLLQNGGAPTTSNSLNANDPTARSPTEHCVPLVEDQTQQETVRGSDTFPEIYQEVTKSSRRIEMCILQLALFLFWVLFIVSLLATLIGTLHLLDHITIFKQFNSFTCVVK
ncbi:hypothetical protein Y032_0199g1675 [Ancylostoma ceylanicum]|uniref:Uncharacterized protein n=1 Tax=Ancylostoma ceylanicum TaxID=53326 RepID=A0A016SMY7_9BILA|nr:hypothetical protein Y032_0199g1675 [Ancylostoma ceylanicum]